MQGKIYLVKKQIIYWNENSNFVLIQGISRLRKLAHVCLGKINVRWYIKKCFTVHHPSVLYLLSKFMSKNEI